MKSNTTISTNASLEIKEELNRIAGDLKFGRAQFLFGAGMSKDFLLPLGSELSKSLIDELVFSDVFNDNEKPSKEEWEGILGSFPFEAIIDGILSKDDGGRTVLINHLKKKLIVSSATPQEETSFEILNSIINRVGYPKLILTTNFDNLFEERIGGRSIPVTKQNFNSLDIFLHDNKIPILHLHGYLGDFKDKELKNNDEIIISERDVFLEDYNPMLRELEKNIYQSNTFVFVGYSLSDPNIKQLYRHYWNDINSRVKSGKKTYIVCPPQNKHFDFLAKKIWEARNVIWLPFKAKEFLSGILESLESLKNKELKESIKKKYNNCSDDVLSEKVKSTKKILGVDDNTALEFLNITH